MELHRAIEQDSQVEFQGLHVYDGHIRPLDLQERISKCDAAFDSVSVLINQIESSGGSIPEIITGGSPSFYPHALRKNSLLSPGTTLLWDLGYKKIWKESPFLNAAVLITRLISKPNANTLCFDLGHKAVASEMPLPRVEILGLENAIHKGQSEEHLMLTYEHENDFKVGDLFYAIPYHICPTVAKYNRAYAIEKGIHMGFWDIEARDYQIDLEG
jgi:D-serine deaminase-like pyridoxal phosphate-dependent protein